MERALRRSGVAVVQSADMGMLSRCPGGTRLPDIAGGIWLVPDGFRPFFKCVSDALLLDSVDSMDSMDNSRS